MTDLNTVLATRARTGCFHGKTPGDEQAYFDAFSGKSPVSKPGFSVGSFLVSFWGKRVAFGRVRFRHARLT